MGGGLRGRVFFSFFLSFSFDDSIAGALMIPRWKSSNEDFDSQGITSFREYLFCLQSL